MDTVRLSEVNEEVRVFLQHALESGGVESKMIPAGRAPVVCRIATRRQTSDGRRK
jgi:hypothetical protein